MNKAYPWQAEAVKRKDKVLAIDAQLFGPTEDDNVPPLKMHSGFSRYVFSMIHGKNAEVQKANIPCDDIAAINAKTQIAMQHYLLKGSSETSSSDFADSPAFTEKLLSGNYKGKSPAEILINDPKEKENLLRQREYLQKNADKFAANKRQIAAIDDAINLLEIGELQSTKPATSNNVIIPIYKTEYKHFTQKDLNGNFLIYSISIVYDSSKNYPFICEISNCFAPVEVLPGGQHRPCMAKAINMTTSSMAMSDVEWLRVISHMTKLKEYFELTSFKTMLAAAETFSKQNRQNNG